MKTALQGKGRSARLCQRQNENASGVGTDRLLSTDDENAEKRYDTYSKKICKNNCYRKLVLQRGHSLR